MTFTAELDTKGWITCWSCRVGAYNSPPSLLKTLPLDWFALPPRRQPGHQGDTIPSVMSKASPKNLILCYTSYLSVRLSYRQLTLGTITFIPNEWFRCHLNLPAVIRHSPSLIQCKITVTILNSEQLATRNPYSTWSFCAAQWPDVPGYDIASEPSRVQYDDWSGWGRENRWIVLYQHQLLIY